MAAPSNQTPPPGKALEVILNTVRAEDYQAILRKSISDPKKLDAFTEATAAALRSNPGVFIDCDKTSLYNSILEAARRGILPDGKQGALAPFNTNVAPKGQKEIWVKKVQFMIMPAGIIEAFARVGIKAYAQSVYANDDFRFWSDDSGQHVEHNYNPFIDRGERIGSYASGITRDGRCYVEAMSMDELARARSKSKNPDKGPWKEWPERMEQKSSLHRLDKRMPGASILGDDDVEPEQVVATVPAGGVPDTAGSAGPVPGASQATAGGPEATGQPARTARLTDESKRPRGLQAIIDAEEAQPVEVEQPGLADTVGSIEQTGESPF
jgi:recombination protein RecT